jgi:hypothetical protein
MQLDALGAARGSDAIPLRSPRTQPRRRRRGLMLSLTFVAAAAAAAALLFYLRPPRDTQLLAALSSGAARPLEGRLSLPGADGWRAWNPERSSARRADALPIAQLARLEQNGNRHAVANGLALSLDLDHAEAMLASLPTTATVESDRAAVALARGDASAALAHADRALALAPQLSAASWNRALALAALGLSLSAAECFDSVAQRGEPGWSAEARERARRERDAVTARHQAWHDAWKDGEALLWQHTLPPPERVRADPDTARLYFYDAVRTATARAEVDKLAPLAAELDQIAGGEILASYLRRIAAHPRFAERAPLASQYAALLHHQLRRPVDDFLADLRAHHEDDILLGALFISERGDDLPEEYAQLAHATGDPWFSALADETVGYADMQRGRFIAAEQTLRNGLRACSAPRASRYRCAKLSNQLAQLLDRLRRSAEAHEVAEQGLAWARSQGSQSLEERFLLQLGDIERNRDAIGLARAYYGEALLLNPKNCVQARFVHETLATVAQTQLDPAEARRELALVPACSAAGAQLTAIGAWVLADLARFSPSDAERARLDETLRALRAGGSHKPNETLQLDVIEGRAAIVRDRARGRALLERAIAAADQLPRDDSQARIPRRLAYSTLLVDDAASADFAGALARLAAEDGVTAPPDRCLLGVAVDTERVVVAARDSNGRVVGRLGSNHTTTIDAATLVPADIVDGLAGCAQISVLAAPPLYGKPRLLPPRLAWVYGVARAAAPSAASRKRLVVSDVTPPPVLRLEPLAPWSEATPDAHAVYLRGPAATRRRVLAELGDADEVELHVHGLLNPAQSDASLLVLSDDGADGYALTAGDVRKLHLPRGPLVVLGACRSATATAIFDERWSLPAAFVEAGARAVVAAATAIPDLEAHRFFTSLRQRIRSGVAPAVALRDERLQWLSDSRSWVESVLVFE